MRGEHNARPHPSVHFKGSSPHARGARSTRKKNLRARGIIHACAGSTYHEWEAGREEEDHPRMRGEHFSTILNASSISGSSPHARGAPILDNRRGDAPRIIPACAGSTRLNSLHYNGLKDHPRMRGEHS